MSSRGARVSAAALAALGGLALVAGAVVLAVARESGESDTSGESTSDPVRPQGRLFAVSRGDPVNVDLLRGENAGRCIAISGDPYLSLSLCDPLTSGASRGAYAVASPVEGRSDAPSLVIGFLPTGKSRAVVTAGELGTIGESRETVFVAVLAPGALGPEGDEPVEVEYG